MRIVNRKSAVALGAALAVALGIAAGAVRAGNGDYVIPAYANGHQVNVLVESVLDPTSQEYQLVEASGIANTVYIVLDDAQKINHVLDIPVGAPGDGDTYNPYWNFSAVIVNDSSVLPLKSASEIESYDGNEVNVIPLVTYNLADSVGIDLGYYTNDVAYVLCPEVYPVKSP